MENEDCRILPGKAMETVYTRSHQLQKCSTTFDDLCLNLTLKEADRLA